MLCPFSASIPFEEEFITTRRTGCPIHVDMAPIPSRQAAVCDDFCGFRPAFFFLMAEVVALSRR